MHTSYRSVDTAMSSILRHMKPIHQRLSPYFWNEQLVRLEAVAQLVWTFISLLLLFGCQFVVAFNELSCSWHIRDYSRCRSFNSREFYKCRNCHLIHFRIVGS